MAKLKLSRNKNTSAFAPVRMKDVRRVEIPMLQHIGAACVPCVQPGERVLAGQLIGRAEAPLCAPVHASVSGTVLSAEEKAVAIESDGLMERAAVQAPQVNSRGEFIQAVRESGLVGLGGAGFPTSVKLESAAGKADILLVNAAECEPYVTADHREALDRPADIIEGIRHICKWLEIKEAIIGGEDKDSAAFLREQCAGQASPELKLRVRRLPGRYPQGAEKVLVKALSGRIIPVGKLPPDAGVLTMNISSVAFVGRYMRTGMPLISRTVTVDGAAAPNPMNLRAPIGVSLREICTFCGVSETPVKIILGGPMMGEECHSLDAVITKRDSCVLFFDEKQAKAKPGTACIRCGACLLVCPMKLQPLKLEKAVDKSDAEAMRALHINNCMECGCCAYVCPARRELVEKIRSGKKMSKGVMK